MATSLPNPITRNFNGERYRADHYHSTKKEAEQHGRLLRDRGMKVRTVKGRASGKQVYYMFTRRK